MQRWSVRCDGVLAYFVSYNTPSKVLSSPIGFPIFGKIPFDQQRVYLFFNLVGWLAASLMMLRAKFPYRFSAVVSSFLSSRYVWEEIGQAEDEWKIIFENSSVILGKANACMHSGGGGTTAESRENSNPLSLIWQDHDERRFYLLHKFLCWLLSASGIEIVCILFGGLRHVDCWLRTVVRYVGRRESFQFMLDFNAHLSKYVHSVEKLWPIWFCFMRSTQCTLCILVATRNISIYVPSSLPR